MPFGQRRILESRVERRGRFGDDPRFGGYSARLFAQEVSLRRKQSLTRATQSPHVETMIVMTSEKLRRDDY
jgi:hypothetical protein